MEGSESYIVKKGKSINNRNSQNEVVRYQVRNLILCIKEVTYNTRAVLSLHVIFNSTYS
jgi:hypothetical protein